LELAADIIYKLRGHGARWAWEAALAAMEAPREPALGAGQGMARGTADRAAGGRQR
jgi:hypothetical protein